MPDPNCEDPACSSKARFFSSLNKTKTKNNNVLEKNTVNGINASDEGFTNSEMPACPLNREELGRSTWGLLHSVAAYYPANPSEEVQKSAEGLVEGIAALYPCEDCRRHFVKDLKKKPISYKNGKELSEGLCEKHNIVNKMLGKEVFSCDYDNLQKRWRKSDDPKCQ